MAILLPFLRSDYRRREEHPRDPLSTCLASMGCTVTAVASPDAALAVLPRQPLALVFLDLRLGQANGFDLIPQLLAEAPDIALIVITAYATVDTAVHAIKRGAKDYLPKRFTPAQIRHVVEQVTEQRKLFIHIRTLEGQLHEATPEGEAATASPR